MATRIGIVHQGRLIEELDSQALEQHRDRRLQVGARDIEAAERALRAGGLSPSRGTNDGSGSLLELRDTRSIASPDEIAELLVKAGVPPTHLAVARETLEDHFIRLTEGVEKAA